MVRHGKIQEIWESITRWGKGVGMLRGRGLLASWIYWFLGLLVVGFLVWVSWFLRLKVSWLLGFTFSFIFQRFKKCFKVFVGRYWSHITKTPFHDYWKILIPDSRFQKTTTTRIVEIVRHASFPKCSKLWIGKISRLKNNTWKNDLQFFLIIGSILGSPKMKICCFGNHGHVQKSRNHGNDGC